MFHLTPRRFLGLRKRELAKAIHTANAWSSDQKGKSLALLQLGTTRRIHSEDHRIAYLLEIKDNRTCCQELVNRPTVTAHLDEFDPEVEVRQLKALELLVKQAKIGREWLGDQENLRLQEELYQNGDLCK